MLDGFELTRRPNTSRLGEATWGLGMIPGHNSLASVSIDGRENVTPADEEGVGDKAGRSEKGKIGSR